MAVTSSDLPTDPNLIVAWVGEGEELAHVERAALRLGRERGARVILYDRDAASAFSDPLPNRWGSQGEERLFGDPLSDQELVKLGVEPMARKVARARADGVDAWGWLATAHGTDELVEYARRHRADLLLLPAELQDAGLSGKLRGETAQKAVEAVEEAEEGGDGLVVMLVERDGSTTRATGRL
jgi:hypothetical protein